MKQKGMKFVKLEVDNDNYNAQDFYKRNGFKKSENLLNGFYMIKDFRDD